MDKQIPGGYNGKLLRVDLTTGKIATERLDEAFCRRYVGGTGFIIHYLLEEVKPDIEPLSPANKLIFATGPLTGISPVCLGKTTGPRHRATVWAS